jgi:hypothetical protein
MGTDDADARQDNHFVQPAGDGRLWALSRPSSRMDQVSMERHQERGILNAIRRLNDSSTPKLKIQPTFVWLSK